MKILTVFGTRPEAIKMIPVINTLQQEQDICSKLCVTAQHRQMLDQVLSIFSITPDYDLDLMTPNQSLTSITCSILNGMKQVLQEFQPDRILVQGDTTTTFAASLAAFYAKIPVGHIEAGLRSGNLYAPWPEEANRRLTSIHADMHFAPTQRSFDNLVKEGVPSNQIYLTGNTVIDAVLLAKNILDTNKNIRTLIKKQFSFIDDNKKLILVTGHRRENFGQGFSNICQAIKKIASENDAQIIYPVHLNPNVQQQVKSVLNNQKNIFLIEPIEYLSFIYLMNKSYLILTDSGGIQEEAPAFGKPVLVMRDITERQEGIIAGTAALVGANAQTIVEKATMLLHNDQMYQHMSLSCNPYGEGLAAKRIVKAIKKRHALLSNASNDSHQYTNICSIPIEPL
jgi:UDP-N-acetylglucosamine 2-epimerase (non-hydrolysing)